MGYLLVLVVAAAAGTSVWALTLRQGDTPTAPTGAWSGTYDTPTTEEPSLPEPVRRRSLPTDPTWHTRLTGVTGLVIACVVAAAVLVAGGFAVWTAVSRAFGG